ncbi:MAG TPA: hypothetical protein VFC38_05620 [Stellaceae bacterium]|nr:hypothetical protein [Stellaceae bacterium]
MNGNISPELVTLLEQRRPLEHAFGKANAAADELEYAIKRKEGPALARAHELSRLREIEAAALTVCDENDRTIAGFPARTIGDCVAKLRIFATEVFGIELFPDDGRLDAAYLRGAIADLQRLAVA